MWLGNLGDDGKLALMERSILVVYHRTQAFREKLSGTVTDFVLFFSFSLIL